MRGVKISLVAVLALAGCDSLNKPKVDNPVMGPPPPRMSLHNEDPGAGQGVQTAENEVPALGNEPRLERVSFETVANNPLSDSQTVAVVNGSPILASEVLERYGDQLALAKQKLPPEQYEMARLALIQQDLQSHVERKLLAEGMKSMLKKEQIEMLDQFIDEAFEKEVQRMMKEAGVNTRLELEEALRQQHTTLATLKTNFANQQMAMEFLRSKTNADVKIGRPELLAYYNEHHEDYHIPARVKWLQILVDFREHDGRDGAQAHLRQIIEKLRPTQGANFAEVAKEMSDGPNAANGGRWEWTNRGSLADERIDKALFELPVGQPSQVFESEDCFKIVMVEHREEERYKPFDELQDEIKETLEREHRKTAAREFIDEMMAQAEITTIFDRPEIQQTGGESFDEPQSPQAGDQNEQPNPFE